MQYNPDQSTYKIVTEHPILIKKDVKYTAHFIIEGSHTYKCVDCLTNVEGANQCVWTFFNTIFAQNYQTNRCDIVCGPIADFYYIS